MLSSHQLPEWNAQLFPGMSLSVWSALFRCFTWTIICRPYADMLERRLAGLKMLCNIRLLPEELPPVKAMEELSRRGIPYAITINAQNEVHRSITLNILHGTPQGTIPAHDVTVIPAHNFCQPSSPCPPPEKNHWLSSLKVSGKFCVVNGSILPCRWCWWFTHEITDGYLSCRMFYFD